MHYLPKAPYVLTIRRGSNEVFIICLELSRFITTGTLRYAIRIPRDTFSTRLINIPDQRHNQRKTVSDGEPRLETYTTAVRWWDFNHQGSVKLIKSDSKTFIQILQITDYFYLSHTQLHREYITSSEMYSLHLTHPKWTHTRSSGQPWTFVITLQKISISNKCCSFELSIHLWILKNKMFPQEYELFSALIIITNVSWAANQHMWPQNQS